MGSASHRLAGAFSVATLATASAAQPVTLAAHLLAQDRALLRAIHTGEREIWDRATTADFRYVEEGEAVPKTRFLAELAPDGTDPLVIVDHRVVRIGDTAIVLHTDRVPGPTAPGRAAGRYVMTETWQRIAGRWQLRLVHVDAVHAAPPVALLDPARLTAFAGRYANGAATVVVKVAPRGLALERANRPTLVLEPETADVFFTRDNLRRRYIFVRASGATPALLIARDENNDQVWERRSPADQQR